MNTFVFDLDYTLLGRDKKVGQDTKSVLMKRGRLGDSIIFATSRPIRAIRNFIDSDLLELATIISLNGAIRHRIDGKVDRFSQIGDRVGRFLIDPNISQRVHFSVELIGEEFGTNAIYTDEELATVHSATREMVFSINDIDITAISKIAIDGLGKDISDLVPELESMGLYPIPCMDGTFLNVVDSEVDKSVTLDKTLELVNGKESNVLVFGDDIPDIRMMELGTRSIALKNAKEEVKVIADDIIGDCDEDTIGEYIRTAC